MNRTFDQTSAQAGSRRGDRHGEQAAVGRLARPRVDEVVDGPAVHGPAVDPDRRGRDGDVRRRR